MLSPEIIRKIKKIHIRTARVVNTMMAGQFKSVFRGSGIEFEEVRDYSPGDEVKSIDWKVSARLGRPFVKRYREERELVVMLLVDMSASQKFGTTESLKMETAAEIAAILAFNAIRNNDKVGAVLFTDRVEKYIPPKKGSGHVWRVIRELFTFRPENTGTDIPAAVRYLSLVCRKKAVVFLISDFLTPVSPETKDIVKPIKTASKKHELIGVLISDPGEFVMPGAGIFRIKDMETGAWKWFDASDSSMKTFYERKKRAGYLRNKGALKSADIDLIEVSTKDNVADALTRYFRFREKRKR